MKKRLISTVAGAILLLSVSASAFAASYNFYFQPPFAGSMNSSGPSTVATSNSAYVQPNNPNSFTATNFFLNTSYNGSTNATNIITNVTTAGKRSFTYNSGYGGIGNSYYLSGYPSNFDFTNYEVFGGWSS
jgi:hypothetical protein